jgi:hypothetical protein
LHFFTGGQTNDDDPPPEDEITPFDGWFNNLVHPDWGGIGNVQMYYVYYSII